MDDTTHDPASCQDCADETIARLRGELATVRKVLRRLWDRVEGSASLEAWWELRADVQAEIAKERANG